MRSEGPWNLGDSVGHHRGGGMYIGLWRTSRSMWREGRGILWSFIFWGLLLCWGTWLFPSSPLAHLWNGLPWFFPSQREDIMQTESLSPWDLVSFECSSYGSSCSVIAWGTERASSIKTGLQLQGHEETGLKMRDLSLRDHISGLPEWCTPLLCWLAWYPVQGSTSFYS